MSTHSMDVHQRRRAKVRSGAWVLGILTIVLYLGVIFLGLLGGLGVEE